MNGLIKNLIAREERQQRVNSRELTTSRRGQALGLLVRLDYIHCWTSI